MKTSKIDDKDLCREGNPLNIWDQSLYLLNLTPLPRKWIVVVCDDDEYTVVGKSDQVAPNVLLRPGLQQLYIHACEYDSDL